MQRRRDLPWSDPELTADAALRGPAQALRRPRRPSTGVSFSIGESECYGLLGPNGAGKTTTISMLCGLIVPDEGEVTVDGFAGGTLEAKAAIGYVPQDLALYPDLSAVENLTFFGQLYGLARQGAPGAASARRSSWSGWPTAGRTASAPTRAA